jgi:hypothetical protein
MKIESEDTTMTIDQRGGENYISRKQYSIPSMQNQSTKIIRNSTKRTEFVCINLTPFIYTGNKYMHKKKAPITPQQTSFQ